MTAKVLQFEKKYVIVSAVCNTCEAAWTATIDKRTYEKRKTHYICPSCGNVDTGLARIQR